MKPFHAIAASLLLAATMTVGAPVLAAEAKPAAPAQVVKGDASDKDKAEIAAVTQSIVTGFSTRNMEAIMSSYSPREDVLVFDISPPLKYVGAKTLRDLNQHWMDSFTGTIEGSYRDLEVTVVGDVAYGSNIQDWKFTRPDGTVFAFTTRLTDVYRKIGGRWRIVQEHGSVPVDLATLKPVLDAK